MTLNYFFAYFSIVFLATIVPGPSMLLALNHGANHGIYKTVYSGIGNLIGNLLMALVSILGLGIVLITSGVIFNTIKWIGVAYLIYIGLRMILERPPATKENNYEVKPSVSKNSIRLFVDGFLIAIGNPKGILFFTALFPQFINITKASVSEITIVFTTLGVIAFGCYMMYATFGIKLNKLFQTKAFRKVFNRISGSIMIGLGFLVAFTNKVVEK